MILLVVLRKILFINMEKPSIPKGTRDFGPDKMLKRQFIFNTIRKVFEKYGYEPIETPAIENLSVLTGKYGDEGDQLLYKILNSGNYLSEVDRTDLLNNSKKLTTKIAEKGLRYDLTVPFARYVVMNQHELTFPFKRYQIQPVWRADKPQKGRYREFYQCDADVVGTDSLVCEAEILLMINEVMTNLGLKNFEIKINNRKLLTAITDLIGEHGKETAFCVAIDKLDKIGRKKVEEELLNNGFSTNSLKKLAPIFEIEGSNSAIIQSLTKMLHESEIGMEAIDEINQLFAFLNDLGSTQNNLRLDLTLARGLSYYTGTILEVRVLNSAIRTSISGGGRYDNLTGVFGLNDVSGVGISFGVDRIYDVMDDLSLFPQEFKTSTEVLLLNFDPSSFKEALNVLTILRAADIKSEIYPDAVKIKKQMNYANKKGVPYVLMVGENEIKEGKYQLKNMKTGEQLQLNLNSIVDYLSK